jgi:electron transport complex protein RnfG
MRTGFKLALICAVATLALGFVNTLTEPEIAKIKEMELKKALASVLKGGEAGAAVNVEDNIFVKEVYPIISGPENGGFVLKLTGSGYGGDMDILAGIKNDGEVFASVLMANLETPGLGKKAEKAEYMLKFLGHGSCVPVPVRKTELESKDADAVTGATITFLGIAKALEAGSDYIRKAGGAE